MDDLQHKINSLDKSRIPVHVAMIMDGNGRWAKQIGRASCRERVCLYV